MKLDVMRVRGALSLVLAFLLAILALIFGSYPGADWLVMGWLWETVILAFIAGLYMLRRAHLVRQRA